MGEAARKRKSRSIPTIEDMSESDEIEYAQECQKKGKSLTRFERHKSAATVREARSLGATSVDLRFDYMKGWLTFTKREARVPNPGEAAVVPQGDDSDSDYRPIHFCMRRDCKQVYSWLGAHETEFEVDQ